MLENQKAISFCKEQMLILFLFLLSTFGYTQDRSCTIYFKDKKILIGFGKIKFDNDIKFKLNQNSESVVYDKNLIEKIVLLDNGKNVIYKFIKIDKGVHDSLWLEVITEGKANLYKYTEDPNGKVVTPGDGNFIGSLNGGDKIDYYMNRNGEKIVYKITTSSLLSNKLKKNTTEFFKDCPTIVEKIQNKTYTLDDIEYVVKLYNTECSKAENNQEIPC